MLEADQYSDASRKFHLRHNTLVFLLRALLLRASPLVEISVAWIPSLMAGRKRTFPDMGWTDPAVFGTGSAFGLSR